MADDRTGRPWLLLLSVVVLFPHLGEFSVIYIKSTEIYFMEMYRLLLLFFFFFFFFLS